MGPDPVLCGLGRLCRPDVSDMRFLPSLRRGQDDLQTLLSSLGAIWASGGTVDWQAVATPFAWQSVDLPTYPWQRQRYWVGETPLEATPALTDAGELGLSSAAHPLLGAATPLADSDGVLFTGRLCLAKHPWLADCAVFDTVVLPGTGLLELTLAAARAVESHTISELTLTAPLVLPNPGAVRVQIQVGAPDAQGRRALTLYGRDEEASQDTPWIRHATGVLAAGRAAEPTVKATLQAGPPLGAQPVELEDLYPRLASQGYSFGPAFQGLREVWRAGDQVYGRAVLPTAVADTAGDYGIHPALLDAALHALVATGGFDVVEGDQQALLLPFAWSEVTLHATGATELWVCLDLSASTGEEEATVALETAQRPARASRTRGAPGRPRRRGRLFGAGGSACVGGR
ncbi:hypothetical protein C2W62_08410 [Candidatus Entotheonella serta]|nr:hypothetical protein C2W62_08410 [Candidatus Entotheonella serta]